MDGLLDQTEVASAVDGVFDQDFVDFAMSKDGDGDGRLMYHEIMQALRAQETDIDEPWTIWPGSRLQRKFHEAMIQLIPKPSTPSTPATPPLGNAPTCELTDSLREIGYTRTYNDATPLEQQALSDLIRAAIEADEEINADGLFDMVELDIVINSAFTTDDGANDISASLLIAEYDEDGDQMLNFRDLVLAYRDTMSVDLSEIWPCADHLPMRFRVIPGVGEPVYNPIHCRS